MNEANTGARVGTLRVAMLAIVAAISVHMRGAGLHTLTVKFERAASHFLQVKQQHAMGKKNTTWANMLASKGKSKRAQENSSAMKRTWSTRKS
jgi:hypothetical protein